MSCVVGPSAAALSTTFLEIKLFFVTIAIYGATSVRADPSSYLLFTEERRMWSPTARQGHTPQTHHIQSTVLDDVMPNVNHR